MNIVIKEAEEKHVIFCVNILQNTGLGTIYFSNYQKAADLKTRECQLIEDIDQLNKKIKLPNLTVEDIATVIENWTKIPIKKITEAESD
jgi:ATP-dependent Clp protease ATP-binding subunit ClpE